MGKRRFEFWYLVVKLIVYVALAVCIVIFHHQMLPGLKYFIGGLMAFYGVEDILFLTLMHRKQFFRQDKTYFGIVELILGIGMLFAPLEINTICMIWATWAIMREAVEIKELILELKSWTPRIISLIESIAAIILSMVLIFAPTGEHAIIHLRILTVELVLAPLVPLLDLVIVSFKDRRAANEADEGEGECE